MESEQSRNILGNDISTGFLSSPLFFPLSNILLRLGARAKFHEGALVFLLIPWAFFYLSSSYRSPMGRYLAVDLGAESGRLLLGNLQDEQLQVRELYRFKTQGTDIHGRSYWNVLRFYDEIINGLQENAGEISEDPIDGIGIDTWGVDFTILDANNQLIGTPYHYRDKQMNSYLEGFLEVFSRDELYDITGMQQLPFNSIVQLYGLVQEEHCSIKEGATFLMIPDFFNFLLTGIKKVEYTDASTTQALDARTKDWHWHYFKKIGVNEDMFSTPVQPGHVLGKVDEHLERVIPSIKGTQVHLIASHDTASAVVGCPLESRRAAYLSSGTWSLLGSELKEPILTMEAMKDNFTNEGGIEGTIRFLKNIMGLWLLQQVKKSWEVKANETLTYEEIIHQARLHENFTSLILPDDPRFMNPPSMVEAIQQACRETGQPIPYKLGEFAETIFKSLALRYREVFLSLEQLSKSRIECLHVVGGGSKNEYLCQYTADALNIKVSAGPIEATSLGNIIVQAISAGEIVDVEHGREIIRNSFTPRIHIPMEPETWDDLYTTNYLEMKEKRDGNLK
ncbi:rhamnulokinase [Candidatus Bathyarchaeota archaeon]|nr:rhamnulokinase [Candidatus Bathyarchaeota archaeon]